MNKKSSAYLIRCEAANKLVFSALSPSIFFVVSNTACRLMSPVSSSVTEPLLAASDRPSKVQFINSGEIIPP